MALTITPETVATDTIIAQLRAIEQLTRTEALTARIRVAQARTDEVRRELRDNAADADRRIERITARLRALDAAPDVLTPTISRVVTLVKSTLEQAQPVEEALLTDLTLEHQLRDRARYVKVLAKRAGLPAVEKLADDLVAKHGETIEWITTVLAEEALGGPAKLAPTPLQRVAGGVAQAITLPTRVAMQGVNRAVDGLSRVGDQARDTVNSVVGSVARVGTDGREVVTAGRDAALRKAEQVAGRDGAEPVADAVHATRAELGSLKASELPIKGFEELSAQGAAAAVRELTDPDQVTTMLAFEERNRNRAGVVSAARSRFAALAKDAARS
ncbi:ferritin-like domain-containing protein [Pseudonocardia humida]|uniref:Ferritin-like domain-containing protein n=1 Tax=Pseudonocardia humida TaxID=2800819 RepID=A0ABT0ZS29_9PSEU|nr:ferritin-like domain-containing protein [Pseudonocardia humida]MCO1653520.1 ferritin-like domain-containing protein [Pseudonocardia humida]